MPRPYWNPYVAGVGLGLTLLFSYLVLGTGLGASGAITRLAVTTAHAVAAEAVEQNTWLNTYYANGNPLAYYLVTMLGGTLLGGFLSAFAAGRVAAMVERGPTASVPLRLWLALLGGGLAGLGARFALGCTSGQALSGGAMLQVGGFVFTGACFAAAFAFAPLVREGMAMNLYDSGLLDEPLGLLLSLLVGTGFGFWLERAGFGSSRKLTAIFYLRDFAVLKVMFSAMVTAALGLQALAALGAIDLAALYVPESIVWPQLVGGFVFGIGFVTGGWCPGTAAVGVASGRLDALVFLGGAGLGSLAFAGLQPQLGGFLQAGACSVGSLPEQFGVSGPTGAFVLLLVALLAFVGATRIEQWMTRRSTT